MSNGNVFQPYELDAFLGDHIGDYDIDGIIAEATELDYEDGNRYWKEEIDLNEICERHEFRAD